MFAAFKERRPLAAELITLVFGPFIGMLYLDRGKLALVYLGLEIFAEIAVLALWVATSSSPALAAPSLWSIVLTFRIAGAVHSHFIARARSASEPVHWYARWYAVVSIFVLVGVVPVTVATALFRTFDTPSASMSPTLSQGDYFLVAKLAYRASAPRRGDMVAFHAPHSWSTIFVKRITGLPGDRVQFVNGIVHINDIAAQLRPIGTFPIDCDVAGCTNARQYAETLPGGRAHRIIRVDEDSPSENTAVFTVPVDSYFVAGDNRDNSVDSRFAPTGAGDFFDRPDGVGFVPGSAIVGRVAIQYFDGTAHRWVWQKVE